MKGIYVTKRGVFGSAVLLLGLLCPSTGIHGADYHVSLDGNDTTGDGSASRPWRTLSHAARIVSPAQGHTILLARGEYHEPEVRIPVGTNVRGNGCDRTIIVAPEGVASDDAAIKLESWPERARGNQTLSDFTVDGRNRSANAGIMAVGRHGVRVIRVGFRNCYAFGLYVNAGWEGGEPSEYLEDIEIAHCTFKNCARNYGGGSTGALSIGGLDSALVHDNIIEEDLGYGIKFWMWGGFKRLQLYRNNVRVPQSDPSWGAGCALELWHVFEDCRVHDNTFDQWTSFVRGDRRRGTNSLVFERNRLISPREDNGKEAVEANLSDAVFRDNYIEQFAKAFYLTMSDSSVVVSNIRIYRNAVYNTRRGSDCVGVLYSCNSLHRDIHVYNNTFEVPYAVRFRAGGEHGHASRGVDGFHVANNLLVDATAACRIEGYSDNLSRVDFSCNLYSSTATSNLDSSRIVVDDIEFRNNATGDPGIAGTGERPLPFYRPASNASAVMASGACTAADGLTYETYTGAFQAPVRTGWLTGPTELRSASQGTVRLVWPKGSHAAGHGTDALGRRRGSAWTRRAVEISRAR